MRELSGMGLDSAFVSPVLEAVASLSGMALLQACVEHLADRLGAGQVLVCRSLEHPPGQVLVLAAAQSLAIMEYDVGGKPCARVYQGQPVSINGGVLPDLDPMTEAPCESYAGLPLTDGSGAVIGHLAVFFPQKRAFSSEFKAALRIIGDRLQAELRHLLLAQRFEACQRREHLQSQVLQLATNRAPLEVVLESVVLGVEAERPQLKCSILLLDGAGEHLCKGAAPSLPEAYNQAVYGLRIGIGVGSCGTAAATGQRVVVEDIQHHPYWASYRDLAARHGLGSCWSEPVLDGDGKVLGTFAMYHTCPAEPLQEDIELIESSARLVSLVLQYYRALEALQARTQRYQQLLETAGDGVVVLDTGGHVIEANRAFLQLIGVSRDDIRHLRPWDWDALLTETEIAQLWQDLGQEPKVFETVVRNPETGLREVEVSTVRVSITGEQLVWAAARDITERKRLEAELRHQATTDALTGITNRRQFLDILAQECQRANRYEHPLSLLMLDLDRFKEVNDRNGHGVGDRVLVRFCQVLQAMLRREDCFGRLGGEEFAILLPETDRVGALEAAERCRQAIATTVVEAERDGAPLVVRITTSIGVALLRGEKDNYESLLARADRALYRAKERGRNRVELSS